MHGLFNIIGHHVIYGKKHFGMARYYQCLWKLAQMEHLPPDQVTYNTHIGTQLYQVYCNPPLRIPQYVFKYNYNYRCVWMGHCLWFSSHSTGCLRGREKEKKEKERKKGKIVENQPHSICSLKSSSMPKFCCYII